MLLYKYLVLVRGTCSLRIIRREFNACFYLEPRIRPYTRIRKSNNEVTNKRGKKGKKTALVDICVHDITEVSFPKIHPSMEGRERTRDIISTQQEVVGSLTNERNHVQGASPSGRTTYKCQELHAPGKQPGRCMHVVRTYFF